jgi:hypothetical protein
MTQQQQAVGVGKFTGECGYDSHARSQAGLQPGEQVEINGKTDLHECVIGNDKACVYSIILTGGGGKYLLSVVGQGPKGAGSGNFYLHFVDKTGDRYLLKLFDSTKKLHTLSYSSDDPAIVKIEWSNHNT